jgi:hypothetical protein
VACLDYYAGAANKIHGETLAGPEAYFVYTRREPVGVCGLITPWNWPANQIACKVAPALACGCTMVLKPSEIAPLSGHVMAEILHEAGVPRGVFNLVDGDGPTVGAALASHPGIDMVSFTGSTRAGILVDKASRANITDTQTATFDFGNLQVRWTHRTWGEGGDPKYPWSATFYGDKGTLKASVFGYDYTPQGGGNPVHKDVGMELDQYPEDQTEKDLEKHCAPAIRGHMRNLLECRRSGAKPVADIEQGHISTASCVLANLSQQLGGRTLRWDPKTHTIVGDSEANGLLARPYRSPWVHPTAASV